MSLCRNCDRPIEARAELSSIAYGYRHIDDERVSCFDVYKPEIATPATEGPNA